MLNKVNILGSVDIDFYEGPASVYSIVEELAISGVNGICFSIHTDQDSEICPFNHQQWIMIKHYCDALNIEFIGRPRALCAIDCFEELGVGRYRIAAEEVGNYLMLEKLARTGKELIISAPQGMDSQIERMVDFVQPYDNNMIMMHWMPMYPCQPGDWGLKRIEWLKSRFGYKVGICDRSGDLFAGSAAVALGAEYLEFKVSDYSQEMRKRLIEGIRKVESSLQSSLENDSYSTNALSVRNMLERSLIFNKDKKRGSIITLEDIEITENGKGIDVSRYYDIVGKALCMDVKKGELLNWNVLCKEQMI